MIDILISIPIHILTIIENIIETPPRLLARPETLGLTGYREALSPAMLHIIRIAARPAGPGVPAVEPLAGRHLADLSIARGAVALAGEAVARPMLHAEATGDGTGRPV